MLWRVIESEVVPASTEHGIAQIVLSPLAQAVLSGKPPPRHPLPKDCRATDAQGGADSIKRWMSNEVLPGVTKLKPVAGKLGLTTAQLAIA